MRARVVFPTLRTPASQTTGRFRQAARMRSSQNARMIMETYLSFGRPNDKCGSGSILPLRALRRRPSQRALVGLSLPALLVRPFRPFSFWRGDEWPRRSGGIVDDGEDPALTQVHPGHLGGIEGMRSPPAEDGELIAALVGGAVPVETSRERQRGTAGRIGRDQAGMQLGREAGHPGRVLGA